MASIVGRRVLLAVVVEMIGIVVGIVNLYPTGSGASGDGKKQGEEKRSNKT